MKGWTWGVELEWPDADSHAPLPDGWAWSCTDYTIVNSDGVANDPKRRLVVRGGELNSAAYDSVDALVADVEALRCRLRPGRNYRSNLHVHIRVPGLEDDLSSLKRLTQYTREHLPMAWGKIDPLDGLLDDIYDPTELRGAKLRKRHSEQSRHYLISEARHTVRMAAKTLAAAIEAEAMLGRDGKPRWGMSPREAVNIRSLRKHGTVEFRCFADPATSWEVGAAAGFAGDWLWSALEDADPERVIARYQRRLPRQLPFVHRLEQGWRWTNFQHNSRAVVGARLSEMGVTG